MSPSNDERGERKSWAVEYRKLSSSRFSARSCLFFVLSSFDLPRMSFIWSRAWSISRMNELVSVLISLAALRMVKSVRLSVRELSASSTRRDKRAMGSDRRLDIQYPDNKEKNMAPTSVMK